MREHGIRKSNSSIDDDFIEDFGQKVDLTQRIREVLLNYPEGTTILKELIQNADDAGASKVCFCVDAREHGTEFLISSSLAEWQGPSLLAYNNANFSEEDFESISRIGDSKKQGQVWKTGRFGVGFNSVYHLSDLPSFVSGKYVVYFDPQCKYLPRVSSINPGKRIDFVTSAISKTFQDQFTPYCAFGCNMEQPFDGTLFRFPLRNVEQAGVSKLSRQSYTVEDMSQLLHDLFEECVSALLFLKNVEAIEISEWKTGANSPTLLYSCSLRTPTAEARWHRQAFSRLSKVIHSGGAKTDYRDVYRMDFTTKTHEGDDSGKENVSSFLISQMMASSSSRIAALAKNAFKDYGLNFVPWGSVAADISSTHGKEVKTEGRAFCFLPLPLKTGLSVHVNGYFELSVNRRDIWYGSDMDRMGKIRSEWNRFLLEDVIAYALAGLVEAASQQVGAGHIYEGLWPVGNFGDPWVKMCRQFYKNVSTMPLLHSAVGGGKWISPSEAIFHDETYTDTDLLADALLSRGVPVVRLSNPLQIMLFNHSVSRPKVVHPDVVRMELRKHQRLIQRTHALVLLEYCLSDVIDDEAAQVLRGLSLIPLENDQLGTFGLRGDGNSYFVCTELEHALLRSIPDRIVKEEHKELKSRLQNIAGFSQSNIWILDEAGWSEALSYIMPREWKNCDEIAWQPGVELKHPNKEWVALFWDYIQHRNIHLSAVEGWPLLPTSDSRMCKPLRRLKLLRSGKIPETVETILCKVGCQFLNSVISVKNSQLSEVVPEISGAVVLDSLSNVSKATKIRNILESEKRELRKYLCELCWSGKDAITEYHIRIFKSLPIFESYNSAGGPEFVAIEGTKKFLVPSDANQMLLGPNFLKQSSARESEVLKEMLGVTSLGRAEFYKWRVISRISDIPSETRDEMMLQILHELPKLGVEDPSFTEILKEMDFVPTSTGHLKAPKCLYDPENLELVQLLDDEEFFPSSRYATPQLLQILRTLGLRTSVLPDTLIMCARKAEGLAASDSEMASVRGRVLLSYLDMNSNKLLPQDGSAFNWVVSKAAMIFQAEAHTALDKFWNELSSICWCPVLLESPHPQLPWPSLSKKVAPPRLVKLQTDMWLVSASMRLLDGQCHSAGVCQRLGWSNKVGGNILAAQLLELGKKNTEVVGGDQHLGQVLAATIPRIYTLLSEMLGTEEMEIVKAVLEGSQWIWVGNGFAKADQVVFDGPLHLAPYLNVIPADLATFKDLLVELGVREVMNSSGYISILSAMAKEKSGRPLDSRQLAAVIWIVQHLADMQNDEHDKGTYVPDTDSILIPASQLVYNDAPWNQNLSFKFVHSKISNDVAEKIGVSSVRRMLLAESADFMDLGLHGGLEAFGQSESLTSRLKHIVEMYADGAGILFELLQNADDAGASEVSFVLDKTHYGESSVLSRQMADWQGPALYCYNNSVFKPQDLYAISRIGQNSKLEKPSAIGRFGLGFNSVYHFTDVPGFVSGTNIVLLDPHAVNLPGITPAQPGLKINFVGRGLLKQFPDQFSPYLLFGCDLEKPLDGTLFRFPLRTATTAQRSEIKQEAYLPDEVAGLFSSLRDYAAEILLFLRNIKRVSVYVREEHQKEMVQIYEVCKKNIDYQDSKLYDFVNGSGSKKQFLTRLEKTSDKYLPWTCGKMKLSLTVGNSKYHSLWLVSSLLGGKNAKEFATAEANHGRGFVPWAGVATKLSDCENDTSSEKFPLPSTFEEGIQSLSNAVEGRVFCFLPLPVKVRLPVHVNGYFELSANRREIWYGADMVGGGRLKSQWNSFLLQDAAAPAYAQLLHRAALELGPCEKFNSLWPTGEFAEPWLLLVQQTYRSIVELDLPVLYTAARGGKWISAKQAVFPDFSCPDINELGNALLEMGLPLASIPELTVSMFQRSCPFLRYLTPHMLRRLLISSRRTFDRKITVLALKYCLSDVDKPEAENKLYGLSLIPLASGFLGTFNTRAAGEKIILTTKDEYDLLKYAVPYMLANLEEIGESLLSKLQKISGSGLSNILLMSPVILKELMPRLFPLEWAGKETVTWTPGQHGHPSLDWMRSLWIYLTKKCTDFSLFANWPLLPTTDGKLLQLVKGGPVVVDDGWTESMASLLQKSGCSLLRKDPSMMKLTFLMEYVHEATASGVLGALFSAAGKDILHLRTLLVSCTASEIRELRHFLFQSKWFAKEGLSVAEKEVLKGLRIFETFKATTVSSQDSILMSIAESNQCMAPEDVSELLLEGGAFVLAEAGKEEQILQSYFGVRKLSKKEYFQEFFTNCVLQISSSARSQALLKILKEIRVLMESAPSSLAMLSHLEFVPTSSGALESPERLYDPRIFELQTLLNQEAFFPCDEFAKDEILDALVLLGLKKSLDRNGLLDCGRSVAMAYERDVSEAARKGKALLGHLDSLMKNYESESEKDLGSELDTQFWMELSSISWCPVLVSSPNPLLPWLLEPLDPIAPPKLVRRISDAWMVSSAMRLLDGDCCSLLAEKLGWLQMPNAGILAIQLIEISNVYSRSSKSQEAESVITEQIGVIYRKFQGFLGTEGMLIVASMLDGHAWLWTGEGFVKPHEAAFDSPAHFHPYLHTVPSEFIEYKEVFAHLGVRDTFLAADFLKVLHRIAADTKENGLNREQLTFVLRVLEALLEVLPPNKKNLLDALLIPDETSRLLPAKGLVYNDAPWLAKDMSGIFRLVHPDLDNGLAKQLGAKSLLYLSVLDQQLTSNLPCIGRERINDYLSKVGGADLLLFDLLEVADHCKARKVHFVYDHREHPKQSLLQPNLGEFQGPALLMICEGTALTTEDICSLHALPPAKIRGQTCRYGSGLLGVYSLTDLLFIISNGYFYLFDPCGQILVNSTTEGNASSSRNPVGKAFSLRGTGLPERFNDQFQPFQVNQLSWESSSSTIFRVPLRCSTAEESEEGTRTNISHLFEILRKHSSTCLLFLKSLEEVAVSEWRDGQSAPEAMFSVSLDSARSSLRHPFQENKWRKFQLSNLFGTSNIAMNKMHTIDVLLKENETQKVLKWLVVQSLASDHTRDMALDRRYLHHQLTPIAGVAACISGNITSETTANSCILSPLPIPVEFEIPVTILGNFLLPLDGARHLFSDSLGDNSVKMGLMGSQNLADEIIFATWNRELLACVRDSYMEMLQELQHLHFTEQSSSYSLWPKSRTLLPRDISQISSASVVDARCLAKWLIRPMYKRLVELPLWQLHGGTMVKFNEGVFVGPAVQGLPPKTSVSDFLKTHYRIFAVPWEVGKEAEEVGCLIKELTPKSLRSLMKVPSVAAAVQSLTTQIDLLEYCCSDVLRDSEDSSENSDINAELVIELKGVTCPTANLFMVKLGTIEIWVATSEQQLLLPSLSKRFVHPFCLERQLLHKLFYNKAFQAHMNLKQFSSEILAANLRTVFPRHWAVNSASWVLWENEISEDWIQSFWENFSPTDLQLFAQWPLVPAMTTSSVLVRVELCKVVFVPPILDPPQSDTTDISEAYNMAFTFVKKDYPWLLPLLTKLNVPVYNQRFMSSKALQCCVVPESLGRAVLAKLVSVHEVGCLEKILTDDEASKLFTFLASHIKPDIPLLDEEMLVLRSLPIYRTLQGVYVSLNQDLHYIVPPGVFMQPDGEHCLPFLPETEGGVFYQMLKIRELSDNDVLIRYALPYFDYLGTNKQEHVLAYIYEKWGGLREENAVIQALKETKFVQSAGFSDDLFRPRDLLDPESVILKRIFSEDQLRFPGGVFAMPRWLQILRFAGLRSIKDADLIIECARKVEDLAKQNLTSPDLSIIHSSSTSGHISDNVFNLGSMLVEEINNNFAAVYSSNFCDTLSSISFVPAEKGIPTAVGGVSTRVFASYRQAILVKDWPLAWTCCPILARPNMLPPEFSWGAFHIRSPPLISVVLKHLQEIGKNGGENVLARWPNAKGSRSVEDVFGDVLKYLSNAWDGLSESDKNELRKYCFIPVANGTRLVTAKSLCTRLSIDLAPFIFEVPRAYLPYVNILSALGMQYEPTIQNMKGLLLHLQHSCGYQHLNPNELEAVLSILKFISDSSITIEDNSDLAEGAVLPDEGGRLVHATSCAYVDAAGSRLVEKVDTTRLRFVHALISEDLCTAFGVKKLSDIVVERLDETRPLEYVDVLDQFALASVSQRLCSDAFVDAIWTRFKGLLMLSTKEQVMQALHFGAKKLRFVRYLYTKFMMLPSNHEITLYRTADDIGHRAFHFFSKAEGILLVAQPPDYLSVSSLLAFVVSSLLDCQICLPIAPLFEVSNSDFERVLEFVSSKGAGIADEYKSGRQLVGSAVVSVDSKALQFCPLRPFYAGEVIAWHPDGQNSDFRYGRVVEDIRAPAGQPLYQIQVEVESGQIQSLLSSNILSFKSTGFISLVNSDEEKASSSSSSHTSISSSSSSSSSTSSLTTSQPSQVTLRNMSSAEYSQAITDILSSLGLPLNMERQSMLEHTLSLQEQLNSVNTSLLTEQERGDVAVKDAETVKGAWTCRVCLSNEVDSVMVPCGHVLCSRCSASLTICPFCRHILSNTLHIYRP